MIDDKNKEEIHSESQNPDDEDVKNNLGSKMKFVFNGNPGFNNFSPNIQQEILSRVAINSKEHSNPQSVQNRFLSSNIPSIIDEKNNLSNQLRAHNFANH